METTRNAPYVWQIPIAELRPLIAEWMEKAGEDGQIKILAARSGVTERRISGIVNNTLPRSSRSTGGYATTVGFDTADRLLGAMGMVNEWHERLEQYYEQPIEIAPYERGRQHN